MTQRAATTLFAQAAALAVTLLLPLASAADEEPTVTATAIKDGLYLLKGRGGNVLVSTGDDGLLMIDDDFPNYQPAYLEAIEDLGADGVRFLINTHWHGDHSGGNAAWGESGSIIMAHENVRRRLSTRQESTMFKRVTEPSPPAAWPMVTYEDGLALHVNDETVEVVHVPTGHTDGDSVIYFIEPNVVHMGDQFFKDRFPFVDLDSGGNVDGYIRNVDAVLARIDGDTVIVPGHGDLADRRDLERYRSMLVATRDAVRAMQGQGMDLAAIQAKGLDPKWESWGTGFINEERWISFIFLSPR